MLDLARFLFDLCSASAPLCAQFCRTISEHAPNKVEDLPLIRAPVFGFSWLSFGQRAGPCGNRSVLSLKSCSFVRLRADRVRLAFGAKRVSVHFVQLSERTQHERSMSFVLRSFGSGNYGEPTWCPIIVLEWAPSWFPII
jgi:hypothetical protein